MLSRWTSGLIALLLAIFATLFLTKTMAAQTSTAASSQADTTVKADSSRPKPAVPATVDEDDDNPDIPPSARGRISEKEYLQLRDQHIGMVRGVNDLARNPQARSQAVRKMEVQEQALRRVRTTATAKTSGQAVINLLSPAWTALGPDPIPNGQTSPTEVAVSGRVTAIAIDPTDMTGNTVYVGTAQGGLYRTLDGGTTWTAMMDGAQSLAIGAITVDPVDNTKVFVGTGEGNLALDSFFGVGLYIITNANASFTVTGPFNAPSASNPDAGITDVFTGRSITRILVNPTNDNLILISTSSGVSGASGDPLPGRPPRGVYLSTNALSATPTFTRQTIQTANINRLVSDMVLDPGNANKILIHVFGTSTANDGGVWVSTAGNPWTSGGATWTQTLMDNSNDGSNPANSADDAHFAANRVGSTTTFLLALDQVVASGTCNGKHGTLFTSPDGSAWNELAAARGFCGGQCFYDMPVAIDPTTASNIFIGGSAGNGIGTCSSGILGKSTNGGASFASSQNNLHADSHAIAIHPTQPLIMYEGNDGGIFRSTDGGTTWTSINTSGFYATQFESIAVHPSDPKFTIGGTQDNGTEFMQPGSGAWTRVDGGDGGFSAIDQTATDTTNVTMYHTYFNLSPTQIGFATVSTVAAATAGNWSAFGCGSNAFFKANGISCSDAVLFYAPLALGPGAPNTVYFGTDRLYRSTNNGAAMNVVSQAPFASGVPISAIGISPQDDNVRLVGLGETAAGVPNGHAFATTSGSNTLSDVTGPWPAMYIARAVIDPNTKTTAYITLDGYGTQANPVKHVWRTTNLSETAGATTWAAASSGLPDVPVNALAVDPTNSNLLYVGTDIGVYNSTDGGATWNPYGTGLPRVAVFDLKITAGHSVRIATHGRGMWEIPAATAFSTTTGLTASINSTTFGTPVTFTAAVNTGPITTIPTGTVTFLDGGTSLGTINITTAGQAVFTTNTLSVASHSITAHYSGDLVYGPSTSSAQVVNVANAPNADYSLNIPTGSATVHAGTPATYTINLTPTNGFTGSVNFACTSGVPTLATCSFSPAAVALNGSGQGTTMVTISTTAPTAAPPASTMGARLATGGGLFGLLLVLGLVTKEGRRRTLFMMLGVLFLTMALTSCGNKTHNPGTPAGTYTVTISATSGSTTHTSTITLTVQ